MLNVTSLYMRHVVLLKISIVPSSINDRALSINITLMSNYVRDFYLRPGDPPSLVTRTTTSPHDSFALSYPVGTTIAFYPLSVATTQYSVIRSSDQ